MKKFTVLAASGVLVYSLIVYPAQLASGTKAAFVGLVAGLEAVISFIHALFT